MTIVLIPGAGGAGWYWHLVVPELEARGHDVVAVDLPTADSSAGLAAYADAVVEAVGDRNDIALVAQSMGAFTAPLVCARVAVSMLILVNPMIPAPGEAAGNWWTNTGQPLAKRDKATREGRSALESVDMPTDFFHDVPRDVVEQAKGHDHGQSATPFAEQWPLPRWPDVPTTVLVGRDDRFFPVEFQRRVAQERLGLSVEELPGGHLIALSQPVELAVRIHELVSRAGS